LTSPCRCVFPDELYIPSAKPTVYTDGNIPSVHTDGITDGMGPSVYTDRFWDEIISVGIHYRRKNSVGNSVAFLRFSGSENLREMVRSNTPSIVFLVLNSYDYANKSFNKWNEDSLFSYLLKPKCVKIPSTIDYSDWHPLYFFLLIFIYELSYAWIKTPLVILILGIHLCDH